MVNEYENKKGGLYGEEILDTFSLGLKDLSDCAGYQADSAQFGARLLLEDLLDSNSHNEESASENCFHWNAETSVSVDFTKKTSPYSRSVEGSNNTSIQKDDPSSRVLESCKLNYGSHLRDTESHIQDAHEVEEVVSDPWALLLGLTDGASTEFPAVFQQPVVVSETKRPKSAEASSIVAHGEPTEKRPHGSSRGRNRGLSDRQRGRFMSSVYHLIEQLRGITTGREELKKYFNDMYIKRCRTSTERALFSALLYRRSLHPACCDVALFVGVLLSPNLEQLLPASLEPLLEWTRQTLAAHCSDKKHSTGSKRDAISHPVSQFGSAEGERNGIGRGVEPWIDALEEPLSAATVSTVARPTSCLRCRSGRVEVEQGRAVCADCGTVLSAIEEWDCDATELFQAGRRFVEDLGPFHRFSVSHQGRKRIKKAVVSAVRSVCRDVGILSEARVAEVASLCARYALAGRTARFKRVIAACCYIFLREQREPLTLAHVAKKTHLHAASLGAVVLRVASAIGIQSLPSLRRRDLLRLALKDVFQAAVHERQTATVLFGREPSQILMGTAASCLSRKNEELLESTSDANGSISFSVENSECGSARNLYHLESLNQFEGTEGSLVPAPRGSPVKKPCSSGAINILDSLLDDTAADPTSVAEALNSNSDFFFEMFLQQGLREDKSEASPIAPSATNMEQSSVLPEADNVCLAPRVFRRRRDLPADVQALLGAECSEKLSALVNSILDLYTSVQRDNHFHKKPTFGHRLATRLQVFEGKDSLSLIDLYDLGSALYYAAQYLKLPLGTEVIADALGLKRGSYARARSQFMDSLWDNIQAFGITTAYATPRRRQLKDHIELIGLIESHKGLLVLYPRR